MENQRGGFLLENIRERFLGPSIWCHLGQRLKERERGDGAQTCPSCLLVTNLHLGGTVGYIGVCISKEMWQLSL